MFLPSFLYGYIVGGTATLVIMIWLARLDQKQRRNGGFTETIN